MLKIELNRGYPIETLAEQKNFLENCYLLLHGELANEQEQAKFLKMASSKSMITINQEKYDVKYYSLDLEPDPSKKNLKGSVIIGCEVLSNELDVLDLNFWDGMNVSKVHPVNFPDQQLQYEHSDDILSISLDSTFNLEEFQEKKPEHY